MENSPPWASEIRQVKDSTDTARELLAKLRRWTWENVTADDVWPRELPADVSDLFVALAAALDDAREAAYAANSRYAVDPLVNLVTKKPLSREEYFVLHAMGLSRDLLPPSWTPDETLPDSQPSA